MGKCLSVSDNLDQNKLSSREKRLLKKTGIKRAENTSNIAAHLPELVLRKILSFLCVEDLINVRMVCKSWNHITMDTLVWKHATLYLRDDFRMLERVPYLHTLVGPFENGDDLLDALIKYVTDLRVIDWHIYDSFSIVKFEKFTRKFNNLEHITLYNECHGFLEVIKALSNCPNLRKLILWCDGLNMKDFSHGCKVIEDGFLALKGLSIYFTDDKKEETSGVVSSLLIKKIQQLIEFTLYGSICLEVSEIVFKSRILQILVLGITECPEIPLDFGHMICLKSLDIAVLHDLPHSEKNSVINIYKKIIFPQNLEYLKVHFPVGVKPHFGLVGNVVSSLSYLRVLSVNNIDDHNLDKQLENISNLQNLHTVILYNCKILSTEGVEYITKCKILRKLEFCNVTFDDSTYECIQKCTYLGELKLWSCILSLDKLLQTIIALKYLTNVYLPGCKHSDKKKNLVWFNRKDSNTMLKKCRSEKHYVGIHENAY